MADIRERLWEKAGKMGVPIIGVFELLPMCNLSCRMCYVRKSRAEVQQMGGLLDKTRWLELAKECRDLGMLYPLITGGEPLLYPDFQEVMAGVMEMGMQASINSNGTLIDREMARWFGSHTPVRINITLYGASEETYEALCGNGDAYRRVCDAVQWLREYHVPIKFNTSLTTYNVDDLEQMMAFAKNAEAPIQVASYMFPPVRRDASLIGQNDRLTPEQAALARVKADYLQAEPDWFLGQTRRFSHFVPLDQLPPERPNEGMRMQCRAGYSSLWIDWQGNLSNCGMYSSVTHPIGTNRLADMWRDLRNETFQVRYQARCTTCPNQWLCHSCIAMVYSECGTGGGRPEYLCKMSEASSRYYREFAEKYYPEETAKILEEVSRTEPREYEDSIPARDLCGVDGF